MQDFVDELGIVVLPHHLRRVVDLMMGASQADSRSVKREIPQRSFSTLELLKRHGPLRVMQISDALQLAHPYVIRKTRGLIDLGLVEEISDPRDGRARLLKLSAKGRAALRKAEQTTEALELTYRELLDEIEIDLFEGARRAKAALEKENLENRISRNSRRVA